MIGDLTQRTALHTYAALPLRPGLRSKWNIQYFQNLQSTAISSSRQGTMADLNTVFSTDRLDFCLWSLAATLSIPRDELTSKDFDNLRPEPSDLFALLDDHITNATRSGKKEDVARLDEILYTSYADLSALTQITSMLQLHRPRGTMRTLQEAEETETGKAWRYTRARYLDQDHREHQKNTEDMNTKITAQQTLRELLGEFLNTSRSTGTKVSPKWLEQDRTQRAASARFWAQMRSRHRQTCERIKIEEDDIVSDLKGKAYPTWNNSSLQRTDKLSVVLSADYDPRHLADTEKEYSKIVALIAAKESSVKRLQVKPVTEQVQTEWGTHTMSSIHSAEGPKTKTKTRSDKPSASEIQDLAISDVAVDETLPQITVAVSKRGLETLQSLYPKSSHEERTKSVDWTTFVSAMVCKRYSFYTLGF